MFAPLQISWQKSLRNLESLKNYRCLIISHKFETFFEKKPTWPFQPLLPAGVQTVFFSPFTHMQARSCGDRPEYSSLLFHGVHH